MPEKAHTKFDDGEAKHVVAAAAKSNHRSQKGSKQESKKTDQTNGVKRFRDGSPKDTATSRVTQQPQNQNTANTRKQITNSSLQANQNHPSQTRPAVSESTYISKSVNGVTQQKPKFTNGAPFSEHHSKTNGKNFGPQGGDQRALKRAADDLLKIRKELPIWSKKADIKWALRHNDVLLLNGETGSGKSTQTPQYLYDEPWCKKRTVKITNEDGREEDISVGGMIAVTEPRRVAAITLAQRVAKEMGSYLGKEKNRPGSVGFSVRFDSNIPQGTRIKFLTEGMLLQEMLRDPNLRQYSAVVVDEIHERSVDVDLIAGFLRHLIHGDQKGRGGIPLKVVIMSATMDLGGLETFFAKPETEPTYIPGKNHGQDFFRIFEDVESNTDDVEVSSHRSPTNSTASFS